MRKNSEIAQALQLIKDEAWQQSAGRNGNGFASAPMVAYGEEDGSDGDGYLRVYWQVIRRRLWLILIVAVLISALEALRQARQPDLYQARSRVQVDTENYSPALGAARGSSVYVESNSYMDPEYFNTQVQILSSPTLLRRVVRTLDLEHNETFLNPRADNHSTWQNLMGMVGFAGAAQKPIAEKNQGLSENSLRASIPTGVDNADEIEFSLCGFASGHVGSRSGKENPSYRSSCQPC